MRVCADSGGQPPSAARTTAHAMRAPRPGNHAAVDDVMATTTSRLTTMPGQTEMRSTPCMAGITMGGGVESRIGTSAQGARRTTARRPAATVTRARAIQTGRIRGPAAAASAADPRKTDDTDVR